MTDQGRHPDQCRRGNAAILVIDPALHIALGKEEKLRQTFMEMRIDLPVMDMAAVGDAFAVQQADMPGGVTQHIAAAIQIGLVHGDPMLRK